MVDFIYNGELAERRVRVLERLRQLTFDKEMVQRIDAAEDRLVRKNAYMSFFKENDLRCYVYADIVLGGEVYDVVTVGKYGMTIVGEPNNKLFDDLDDVYLLDSPEDMYGLKQPLISNKMKVYSNFIVEHMDDCSLTELIGDMIYIDQTAFVNSELWKELDTRRLLLAEYVGTEPHLIYRVGDVVELLNLAPESPVLSVNINEQYQQVILKAWQKFLE